MLFISKTVRDREILSKFFTLGVVRTNYINLGKNFDFPSFGHYLEFCWKSEKLFISKPNKFGNLWLVDYIKVLQKF